MRNSLLSYWLNWRKRKKKQELTVQVEALEIVVTHYCAIWSMMPAALIQDIEQAIAGDACRVTNDAMRLQNILKKLFAASRSCLCDTTRMPSFFCHLLYIVSTVLFF
ncbi:hypothetical protein LAD77_30095 [Klebsiella pneumoniae]|nr:hypothetical protein [Klebsiella pneumoniae]